MKELFSIILLFLGTQKVFGQNYIPLLSHINEWKLTSCSNGCIEDVYYTNGDTIVDGQAHKILDGFHFISRKFLLRENTTERKVYLTFISPSNLVKEYLLYDFSLQVGDTMELTNPISPFPTKAGVFEVDSIVNRTLLDGLLHRYFYLSPVATNSFSQDPCVWVEGIGSLSLINAPGGMPNINGAGHLSCFFKDTALVYSNLDSIARCAPSRFEVSTGLAKVNLKLEMVLLNRMLVIRNEEERLSVHVYAVNGENVLSTKETRNNEMLVDLSKLNPGLYFLQIENEEGQRQNAKFILE